MIAGKGEVREGGPPGGPARANKCSSAGWVRAWPARAGGGAEREGGKGACT